MVKVEAQGTGWLIDGSMHFGPDHEQSAALTLCTVRGEQVRYGQELSSLIDFPGEYDINGVSIKAWYAKEAMSYLVKTDKENVALVANAAALDLGSFDEAETILCLTDEAAQEAEKMELEGDIMSFDAAAHGGASDVPAEQPNDQDTDQAEE